MQNPNQQPALPQHYPLCDGLRIHERDDGKGQSVLEDSERGKYFRLGKIETCFVAALIDTQSPVAAYERCQTHSELAPLSLESAIALCKWLASSGLTRADNPASSMHPTAPPQRNLLAASFFWRVRLLNPDRFLCGLVRSCGWLFSPHAMIVGLFVFIAGLVQTTGQWPEFVRSYEALFSSWRWLLLAVAWCVLKIIHETAHGATCRRYGGEVKDAGLAMILFIPIAFVNVTSSWRFKSRWQRLHVTMAGVAAELFIAGVALIAWNMLDSLPLKQAAADIVLLASVSSILFNLNPLLKFDGYFAIADASGVDNLYSYGQRYARYFGARYFLGLDATAPKLPSKHPGWIKFYGLSSAAYRVVTVTGLLIGAAALFHGAGIVIAIAGISSFILKPLSMLGQHVSQLNATGRLSISRLALRVTCLLILLASPLWIIPAKWHWTAPAIVEYDPPAVLRNRPAGFIETIHVADGQHVAAGQPIVTLRNEELELRLLSLKRQFAQVQQETLAARWRGRSAELCDAETRESALQAQIAELGADVDGLVVRSSCRGTVVSRQLELLLETYVEPGTELAVVGSENAKRLMLSVSQTDARNSDRWASQPLKVIVDGNHSMTAMLSRLETRASSIPPDASLIASNGGPLSAIQLNETEFSLCEPRINAYISLTPEQSQPLRCGQRAYVRLNTGQSIGSAAVNFVSKQIKLKL